MFITICHTMSLPNLLKINIYFRLLFTFIGKQCFFVVRKTQVCLLDTRENKPMRFILKHQANMSIGLCSSINACKWIKAYIKSVRHIKLSIQKTWITLLDSYEYFKSVFLGERLSMEGQMSQNRLIILFVLRRWTFLMGLERHEGALSEIFHFGEN